MPKPACDRGQCTFLERRHHLRPGWSNLIRQLERAGFKPLVIAGKAAPLPTRAFLVGPPPVDKRRAVRGHRITTHANPHQRSQASEDLPHVCRRQAALVPAQRTRSGHDHARCDAETGAKNCTRILPGHIASTRACSLAAGLPVSAKRPLSAAADSSRYLL